MGNADKRAVFREEVRSVIKQLEATISSIERNVGQDDLVWSVSVGVQFQIAHNWMEHMKVPSVRELEGEFDE